MTGYALVSIYVDGNGVIGASGISRPVIKVTTDIAIISRKGDIGAAGNILVGLIAISRNRIRYGAIAYIYGAATI